MNIDIQETKALELLVLVLGIVFSMAAVYFFIEGYIFVASLFLVVDFFVWLGSIKYGIIFAVIFLLGGLMSVLLVHILFAIFFFIIAGVCFMTPQLMKEEEIKDEIVVKEEYMPAVEHSVEDSFTSDRNYY